MSDPHQPTAPPPSTDVSLTDFQAKIKAMYYEKDIQRGVDGTFMWLMEEIGELASARREGSPEELSGEFADVLAWLATIANVAGIDLGEAVRKKYGDGCPGCGRLVCDCPLDENPKLGCPLHTRGGWGSGDGRRGMTVFFGVQGRGMRSSSMVNHDRRRWIKQAAIASAGAGPGAQPTTATVGQFAAAGAPGSRASATA